MMKCVIVDDEKVILDELCLLMKQTNKVSLKGAYQDPHLAFEHIKTSEPDVVFLDVEMPELSGIELAKKIAKINPKIQIVFVTAYEQYALKAFEVSAIHYLLKPVTIDKLNEAIDRVQRAGKISVQKGNVDKPIFFNNKTGVTDRISVRDRDNIIIIKIDDILYLKSEGGKTIIVTKEGSFKSRIGLKFWESKLNESGFIRCHRSYIVNTNYISKLIHILGEYKELALKYCDVNIPISRQKIIDVKQWLGIV